MMNSKVAFALVPSFFVFTLSVVRAESAPDEKSVLILADTIGPTSPSLEESVVVALGYTVVVVDATTWGAMTTVDFSSYQAVVLGDKSCGGFGTSPWLDAALNNRTVWSLAVTGNIVVIGTDPTYHSSFWAGGLLFAPYADGDQLTESGIAFAAAGSKTGLYLTLSCYYHGVSPLTPVPILDQFGLFTVTGVGCYNNSHIVAVHPVLDGLVDDSSLSNWGCSVHEAFDSFPSDWSPIAIAKGLGGHGYRRFADGSRGLPYIIVRDEDPALGTLKICTSHDMRKSGPYKSTKCP